MVMDLADLYRNIVETFRTGFGSWTWRVGLCMPTPEIARIHGIPRARAVSLTVFDTLDETGRHSSPQHLDDVRAGRLNDPDVEVPWVRQRRVHHVDALRRDRTAGRVGATHHLLHRLLALRRAPRGSRSAAADEHALEDQISRTASSRQSRVLPTRRGRWPKCSRMRVTSSSSTMTGSGPARSSRRAPSRRAHAGGAVLRRRRGPEEDGGDPFAAHELALAQRCSTRARPSGTSAG